MVKSRGFGQSQGGVTTPGLDTLADALPTAAIAAAVKPSQYMLILYDSSSSQSMLSKLALGGFT
ncbi:hypothetical protein BH23CHL5_BH23CHL5_23510 [soil metagenome]